MFSPSAGAGGTSETAADAVLCMSEMVVCSQVGQLGDIRRGLDLPETDAFLLAEAEGAAVIGWGSARNTFRLLTVMQAQRMVVMS